MELWVADRNQLHKILGYFDNPQLSQIPILDPIFQYSNIPAFQPHAIGCQSHPYGVKPKPGPLQDSLFTGFSDKSEAGGLESAGRVTIGPVGRAAGISIFEPATAPSHSHDP